MSQAIEYLSGTAWTATALVCLVMSIGWRRRLGRAKVPAIAGFTTLLAVEVASLGWRPSSSTKITWDGSSASFNAWDVLVALPPADLAFSVMQFVAYPAGLGLLVLAVLRGPYRAEGEPPS